MQNELQSTVSRLLEEAHAAAQQGEREKAYQISLEATRVAPDDPLAWYLRSRNAASHEEELMCLSRAYALDTKRPEARTGLRGAVQELLKKEPFLAYVYETEELYQVRSGRDLLINIPKNRAFETLLITIFYFEIIQIAASGIHRRRRVIAFRCSPPSVMIRGCSP